MIKGRSLCKTHTHVVVVSLFHSGTKLLQYEFVDDW